VRLREDAVRGRTMNATASSGTATRCIWKISSTEICPRSLASVTRRVSNWATAAPTTETIARVSLQTSLSLFTVIGWCR